MLTKIKKTVLNKLLARQARKVLDGKISKVQMLIDKNPKQKDLGILFNELDDPTWFWALTEGGKHMPFLKELLPAMPDEKLQAEFTGAVGFGESFEVYSLFKKILTTYNNPVTLNSKGLDFGCGWGRFMRVFLKDMHSENFFGVDINETIIQVCKDTKLPVKVNLVDAFPPTDFADDTFDFIYAYSVFSHISEESHLKWLSEFKRILKPGGVVMVTTRARDFIPMCEDWRYQENTPFYLQYIKTAFPNIEEALADYDLGRYCYSTYKGMENSHYGEACIPRKYVYSEWIKYFSEVDFLYASIHKASPQNVIIAKK